MAIVLPVLLILTLGLIEYGWVFLKISQINQAARHGVRTAVRPGSTQAEVDAAVEYMMASSGMAKTSSQYTLTYAYIPEGGVPTSGLNAAVGEPLIIQIAVNYSTLSLTGTGFLPLPTQLQGRGTMAKEGPPPGP